MTHKKRAYKRELFLRESFMEVMGNDQKNFELCATLAHIAMLGPSEYHNSINNRINGSKIKMVRLGLNYKQSHFADTLGICQSYLSKIEAGERPLPKKSRQIAELLYGIKIGKDGTVEV